MERVRKGCNRRKRESGKRKRRDRRLMGTVFSFLVKLINNMSGTEDKI